MKKLLLAVFSLLFITFFVQTAYAQELQGKFKGITVVKYSRILFYADCQSKTAQVVVRYRTRQYIANQVETMNCELIDDVPTISFCTKGLYFHKYSPFPDKNVQACFVFQEGDKRDAYVEFEVFHDRDSIQEAGNPKRGFVRYSN